MNKIKWKIAGNENENHWPSRKGNKSVFCNNFFSGKHVHAYFQDKKNSEGNSKCIALLKVRRFHPIYNHE